MDTINNRALQDGDLVSWVMSLPTNPDDFAAYEVPDTTGEVYAPAYHVLYGTTDILCTPAARVDGRFVYEVSMHSHADEDTARECHRSNVANNRRRAAEAKVNPERASERAQAERMGVPMEIIDRLVPLTGESVLDKLRERMPDVGEIMPTSGPPYPGFYM